MLSTPAEFPAPGSTAWLRPGGEEVRIIQRRADGRALVSRAAPRGHGHDGGPASRELTVAAADLAASPEEASRPARRKKVILQRPPEAIRRLAHLARAGLRLEREALAAGDDRKRFDADHAEVESAIAFLEAVR